MKCKCVKLERLAVCIGGDIETFENPWTELYSPVYSHPYSNETRRDEWIAECARTECPSDVEVLSPLVGDERRYLTDDLMCLSERMMVDVVTDDEWRRTSEDLYRRVMDVANGDGAPHMFTVGDATSFATFRATPMERIPDLVPFATPETRDVCGYIDVNCEIPERIYVILRNAIHAANGDPLEELPPPETRTFVVRASRTDETECEIEAASPEEALEKAREDHSFFLQSDPDHTCDDWKYSIVR